jgi:hypothetical protein
MSVYAFGPAIADIFAQPQRVFQAIIEKTLSAWVPLIVVFVSSLAVFGWYFMTVDMEAFIIAAAAQSGTAMTPETLVAIRDQTALLRITTLLSSVVSQVGIPFVIALYCSLVANVVSDVRSSYGQWLAVVAWSSIPGLISLLSMAISIAIAQDGAVAIESLDRTTLNNLAFHFNPQDAGYVAANAVSLGSLWSWLISVLGFSLLAKVSTRTAALLLLAPIVFMSLLVWLL